MEPWQRSLAHVMLGTKLGTLHGEAFEEFFHDLMERGDPGFFPVRTQVGDQGADGLVISDRKLYACNGPKKPDEKRVRQKFRDDLAKAVEHRGDEFDTFVFVHNDLRGLGPAVSSEISEAQREHPHLRFENCGLSRMFQVLRRLDIEDVEDFLGPFPAREVVTDVGMAELVPLLDHLEKNRKQGGIPGRIPIPPGQKLDFNGFSPDRRESLLIPMRYVHLVETYYAGRNDPLERDEVAAGFRKEYLELSEQYDDPDTVMDQLTEYILGTRTPSYKKLTDAWVVLMYFFGECEIFKIPPPGWQPPTKESNEPTEDTG